MSNFTRAMKKNNWSELEDFIRENMKPVRPRESFVNNLRQDLTSGDLPDLSGVNRTMEHLLTLLFLVSSLAIIAFIVRVVVGLVSNFRTHH